MNTKMNSQPTVLIADDEPEVLNVVKRFLTRKGYDMVTAANGAEALGKSKVQKPDIILLDINMPEMDGMTVCRKLREDPLTRLTPIVFVSARGKTDDKVSGLNIGADDYITKPFELEELQARIDVLLKRNQNMIAVNPLTRLPGNTAIQEAIEEKILRKEKLAVAYVDVDHFKAFNDSYGYYQGDQLILWMARMLQEQGRKHSAFVGHIGGDDFILMAQPEAMPAKRVPLWQKGIPQSMQRAPCCWSFSCGI